MKIYILAYSNPWLQNSASTNRLLSLVEGLGKRGVIIKVFIYGGYLSNKEKYDWTQTGNYMGFQYEYINEIVYEGYWKVRWNYYIVSKLQIPKIFSKLEAKINHTIDILWTDTTLIGFKLAYKLKKEHPRIKIFTEISEFLDIQQYTKGNSLQRWVETRRQKYFEQKAFFVYDGMALMTKTLVSYFSSFPTPHPKFLHLPMTVDLDRFRGDIIPLPEFQIPYIAFVGVMSDEKDGLNVLIKAFYKIKDYNISLY